MAGSVRFELNRSGIAELLKSPLVEVDVMTRANAVAAAAGPGHDVKNTTTNRARATVMTTTVEAMESEATNHTLTKAINAARG